MSSVILSEGDFNWLVGVAMTTSGDLARLIGIIRASEVSNQIPSVPEGAITVPAQLEEYHWYNIYLVSWPADRQIDTIKAVRQISGFGLKDAKEWVEAHQNGRARMVGMVAGNLAEQATLTLERAGAVWYATKA